MALTIKDRQEGRELVEMLESLPEKEKLQATIYIGALCDREKIARECLDGDGSAPDEEVKRCRRY